MFLNKLDKIPFALISLTEINLLFIFYKYHSELKYMVFDF